MQLRNHVRFDMHSGFGGQINQMIATEKETYDVTSCRDKLRDERNVENKAEIGEAMMEVLVQHHGISSKTVDIFDRSPRGS